MDCAPPLFSCSHLSAVVGPDFQSWTLGYIIPAVSVSHGDFGGKHLFHQIRFQRTGCKRIQMHLVIEVMASPAVRAAITQLSDDEDRWFSQ